MKAMAPHVIASTPLGSAKRSTTRGPQSLLPDTPSPDAWKAQWLSALPET
eukprot:jgi/Botrbrau1/22652/Bobra.176_1s0074.1